MKINNQTKWELSEALVSAVIHLAQVGGVTKKEVAFVHRFIRQIVGESTPSGIIEERIVKPISLRESCYIIKDSLSMSDKKTLLLILLSLLYLEEGEFLLVGSLQIISFVDLLMLNVDFYNEILDIIEEGTNSLNVKTEQLKKEIHQSKFKNKMIWGGKNCDVFLHETIKGSSILFWIINDQIFVALFDEEEQFFIQDEKLVQDKMYLLRKEEKLIYRKNSEDFNFSHSEIMNIFEYFSIGKNSTIQHNFGLNNAIFKQKSANLFVTSHKKRFLLPHKSKTSQVALTQRLNSESKITGIDILLHYEIFNKDLSSWKELYIDYFADYFRVKPDSKDYILKLTKENEKIFIEKNPSNQNPVYIDKFLLTSPIEYSIGNDVILYNGHHFKINSFMSIEKSELDIKWVKAKNLYHEFNNGKTIALNDISFEIKKGEFMAIMGPSGSGKTTLLKTLLGEIKPISADIKLNEYDFIKNFEYFQKYIAYVPQVDLLFENLTVYDNLYYAARLRLPHIKQKSELDKKIKSILQQVDLWEKRDLKVGTTENKILSGGQRKRLNIAIELLAEPAIIILDEPTSGLSSKDTEKLIEFFNTLKNQGKIILSTIHQPNAEVFGKFDKLLLLDIEGTPVFFGKIKKIFDYLDDELEQIVVGKKQLEYKKQLQMPEYIFDILEYKTKGIGGESVRKFSQNYWKDKFNQNKLLQMMSDKNIVETDHKLKSNRHVQKNSLTNLMIQLKTVIIRNFKNKISNKMNNLITFLGAPFLALLSSIVLRYYTDDYSYYDNENILLFIFISIIIFIFLGLSNSMDEIMSEKRIFRREKKMGLIPAFYLFSKFFTLTVFVFVQVTLFYLVSAFVLKIHGLYWIYLKYLGLAALNGVAIGLFTSSILRDRKAIINILPIVLIPQIMFAGAVIPFDKMNPLLKFGSKEAVPEFCNFIPSRWLFEGLIIDHTENNYYQKNIEILQLQRKYALKNDRSLLPEISKKYRNFLQKNDQKKFENRRLEQYVAAMTGKQLNNKANIFLAKQYYFFSKIINKSTFNASVMIFFNMLLLLLTWYQLKYKIK